MIVKELQEEVERFDSTRQDLMVQSSKMHFRDETLIVGEEEYKFSPSGLKSFLSELAIPASVINCLSEDWDILEEVINRKLRKREEWFLRVYDSQIWGILTPKYRSISHLEAIEFIAKNYPENEVTRVILNPELFSCFVIIEERELKGTDWQCCVRIENSETGWRALCYIQSLLKKICTNGLFRTQSRYVMRFAHVGKREINLENIFDYLELLNQLDRPLSIYGFYRILDSLPKAFLDPILPQWQQIDNFNYDSENRNLTGVPQAYTFWDLATNSLPSDPVKRLESERLILNALEM